MSPLLEAAKDTQGNIIPDEYFLIEPDHKRPGYAFGSRITPKWWGFKEQDSRILKLTILDAANSLDTTPRKISQRLKLGESVEW